LIALGTAAAAVHATITIMREPQQAMKGWFLEIV